MSDPEILSNGKISRAMARILPYLTYGDTANIELLLSPFISCLDFEKIDTGTQSNGFLLDCFCQMVNNIKNDTTGCKLKDLIIEKGIVLKAVNYILTNVPENFVADSEVPDEENNKDADSSEKKPKITDKVSLPSVLQLLAGMAHDHQKSQKDIEKCIDRVHLLEHVTSSQQTKSKVQIGSLAENLMEALDDPEVKKTVEEVRETTKKAKREKALAKREQLLKDMGFKIAEGKTTIVATTAVAGINDLTEESGPICLICREGYAFKAEETLGLYVYTKKCELDDCNYLPPPSSTASANSNAVGSATNGMASASVNSPDRIRRTSDYIINNSNSRGFTTVTHFHMVHFSCHREAVKADRNKGRNSLSEWEGATLRNNNTKCNNLLPIRGPDLSLYPTHVEAYFNNISVGRDSARFRCMVHDFKLLLKRFACELSFSVESLGGGRDSNIGLLVYQIQLGMYLLDLKSSQRSIYEPVLFSFINEKNPQSWLDYCFMTDGVLYLLSLSVFLLSYEQWTEHRLLFLKRIFLFAHARFLSPCGILTVDHFNQQQDLKKKTIKPTTKTTVLEGEVSEGCADGPIVNSQGLAEYDVYKSALVFWTYIDKIQEHSKGPKAPEVKKQNIKQNDRLPLTDFHNVLMYADVALLDKFKKMLGDITDEYSYCTSLFEYMDCAEYLDIVLKESPTVEEFFESALKLQ